MLSKCVRFFRISDFSLFLVFPLSGVRCCLQLFHRLICYSSPPYYVSCLLLPVSLLSCLLHISLYTVRRPISVLAALVSSNPFFLEYYPKMMHNKIHSLLLKNCKEHCIGPYKQWKHQHNTCFRSIYRHIFVLEACHICTASLRIYPHGNVNNSKLMNPPPPKIWLAPSINYLNSVCIIADRVWRTGWGGCNMPIHPSLVEYSETIA